MYSLNIHSMKPFFFQETKIASCPVFIWHSAQGHAVEFSSLFTYLFSYDASYVIVSVSSKISECKIIGKYIGELNK